MLTQAAVSGAQDWLQGLKENVIIGRLIPARVEIPGMEELLKPQPVPEIAAVSLEGWLGASDGEEAAPSGAFDQLVGEDDVPAEPNIFTDGNDGAGEEAAANTDSPEMAVEEEEDDTPVDAPDDELDAEEEEDEDLDVAETGELSTNGTSPAFGEEDAEGNDEPTVATDNEGDE